MKKLLCAVLALTMIIGMAIIPTASAEADNRETITVTIFDRGNVPAEKGGNYEQNDVTEWINANAPVKVEFVACGRWDTSKNYNLWLAAGTAPDLIMEYQPEMTQLFVNQGVLTELSKYIDEFGPTIREKTPEEVAKWGMYSGGEYAIPDIRPETGVPNWMTYIRKDWLDNLGLAMPTNADELLEVIRAFTEDDPDQNGAKDTYGWNFGDLGRGTIINMFGAQDGTWVPGDDGQFEAAYISDRYRDAYAFMEKIYDSHYADIEFPAYTSNTEVFQQFATGKLGIVATGIGYLSGNIWETLMANNPNAVVIPLGSVTENGLYQERECSFLNMVPTTCKNPGAVVQYLDWMMAGGWEGIGNGTEGTHYEWQDDLLVRTCTDEVFNLDLKYRGDYVVMSPYKLTIDMQREVYGKLDDANVLKAAYMIQCDAMEWSLKTPYARHTPTNDLGLEIITDMMPDMNTIATETWFKALTDANYTADQALEDIRSQWAGMGYDEVKSEFNATAAEQGITVQ